MMAARMAAGAGATVSNVSYGHISSIITYKQTYFNLYANSIASDLGPHYLPTEASK